MGRPKLAEKQKKDTIAITVSKELKAYAMATGNASLFFESAARQQMEKDIRRAQQKKESEQ